MPVVETPKVLEYQNNKSSWYRKLEGLCTSIYEYHEFRHMEAPENVNLKARKINEYIDRKNMEEIRKRSGTFAASSSKLNTYYS